MRWVFDLDGTLVHTAHDYGALKRDLGLPPDLAVLEGLAAAPASDRPALAARIDAWEQAHADAATPFPGADRVLRALGPVAILTRNTRATALRSLRAAGLDGLVAPGLVFGRDEAPHKPAPDGVHLARRALGPGPAALVGDGRFDLLAARAAGVAAVWFDPERSGVHAGLADRVVHALDELLAPLTRPR